MLLLACSFVYGADYLRMEDDGDMIVYENTSETLSWYILRECPDPAMIMGCSNGWVVNAVGNATWDFAYPAGYTAFANQFTVWNLGGLLFTDNISGTAMTTGWFLTGGAAMPPAGGMPVYTTEEFWFSLDFSYGDLPDGSTGDQICFDSAFVGAAGAWKFSGLTCGLGGAPDRPLFLCGPAGDDVHPCCIDVEPLVCTAPDINVTPVGDLVVVDICGTASFFFGADPGMDGLNPATIAGWSVTSGIGTIDAGGHYTASVAPDECGIYDVTIEVENSCGLTDTYSFQVEFVNADPYFVGCPDNCGGTEYPVGQGNDLTIPLVVGDPDACQALTVTVCGIDEFGDIPFLGTAYWTA